MRRTAFEWHGESFRDQDFAHVATGRFQRSAIPTVVASGRPLRSGRTRASDKLKIEIAGPNKFAHSPRRLVAQVAFRRTCRAASFGRIEPD